MIEDYYKAYRGLFLRLNKGHNLSQMFQDCKQDLGNSIFELKIYEFSKY